MSAFKKIQHFVNDWKNPEEEILLQDPSGFLLRCSFSNRGANLSQAQIPIPDSLKKFWELCEEALLFEDVDYGQWGLKIFSPQESIKHTEEEKQTRNDDFSSSELIIGEFLGDSDLLVINTDIDSDNFEKVFVALPIDPPEEWPVVGNDFLDFLARYIDSNGRKFWE